MSQEKIIAAQVKIAAILATPEMIEAGLDAYRELRGSEASDFHEREIVEAIYSRMATVMALNSSDSAEPSVSGRETLHELDKLGFRLPPQTPVEAGLLALVYQLAQRVHALEQRVGATVPPPGS